MVTLNTDIENSRRIAYVGSNYTRSGATAAGLLQLMTSGTVNVGIVTGSSNILCHTERIAGFLKTLEPFSDRIRVVDTVEIHDDEVESYEKDNDTSVKAPGDQCTVLRRRRCLRRLPQCRGSGKKGDPDHRF